jgi:hypothetical protein
VVEFVAVRQGADVSLTDSNLFEIGLLCDERSVGGKSIRQKVSGFIEHPPSGETLWLPRRWFPLGRDPLTSEADDFLRCNLVNLIYDSAALEISAVILSRIIGFGSSEGRLTIQFMGFQTSPFY